jgi:hypothetical protein
LLQAKLISQSNQSTNPAAHISQPHAKGELHVSLLVRRPRQISVASLLLLLGLVLSPMASRGLAPSAAPLMALQIPDPQALGRMFQLESLFSVCFMSPVFPCFEPCVLAAN